MKFIKENCYNKERIKQLKIEIEWINDKLLTKKMSNKQIKNYLHQIEHKKLDIMLYEKEIK